MPQRCLRNSRAPPKKVRCWPRGDDPPRLPRVPSARASLRPAVAAGTGSAVLATRTAQMRSARRGYQSRRALPYVFLGFLTSMNPPPARASTPTMNDAVARRSWFVEMNTIPMMHTTTPTAKRIRAVVRFDDCPLDPAAELMTSPRCFDTGCARPAGAAGHDFDLLTPARYYVPPSA